MEQRVLLKTSKIKLFKVRKIENASFETFILKEILQRSAKALYIVV